MTPYGLSSEERARRLAEMHAEPGSDVDAQVAELRQRIATLEDALRRIGGTSPEEHRDDDGGYSCDGCAALSELARAALVGRPSETKGEP